MGSSSSVIRKLGSNSSSQLTVEDIQRCEKTWEIIVNNDLPEDSPFSKEYKQYNLFFYSSCFLLLKERYSLINNLSTSSPSNPQSKYSLNQSNNLIYPANNPINQPNNSQNSSNNSPIQSKQVNNSPNQSNDSLNQANTLHTIVIFMLKIISIYITSLTTNKSFQKFSKSISLSSSHLGITIQDYYIFQKIFLEVIKVSFINEEIIWSSWKVLYSSMLLIVIPECQNQESLSSIKRQLRLTGSSNLRDSPEKEVIAYYSKYAFRLISTINNEENDFNSVNSRLSTSMHNSIENEYEYELNRYESLSRNRQTSLTGKLIE